MYSAAGVLLVASQLTAVWCQLLMVFAYVCIFFVTVLPEFVVLQVWVNGHANYGTILMRSDLPMVMLCCFNPGLESGLASQKMMKPCALVLCKEAFERF